MSDPAGFEYKIVNEMAGDIQKSETEVIGHSLDGDRPFHSNIFAIVDTVPWKHCGHFCHNGYYGTKTKKKATDSVLKKIRFMGN